MKKMGPYKVTTESMKKIKKPPFKTLERKLNERLIDLKKQGVLDDPLY